MQLTTETRKFRSSGVDNQASFYIDEKAAEQVMAILRDMYSNPVRAILREYGANALDSHTLAKKPHESIEVQLPTLQNPVLRIRDFGFGLSEAEEKLLIGYGSSGEAKRESNDIIGGFGIGGKCAFSILDQFTYINRHSGRKRTIVCYRDDHDKCKASVVSDVELGDELPGLEVILPIPVDYLAKINEEARTVFAFYPVQPKFIAPDDWKPDEITVGEIRRVGDAGVGFERVECSRGKTIVMGHIAYPLDVKLLLPDLCDGSDADIAWDKLLSSYRLWLPIGWALPAPSRESLRYSRDTIRKLASVIKAGLSRDQVMEDVFGTGRTQRAVATWGDVARQQVDAGLLRGYGFSLGTTDDVLSLRSILADEARTAKVIMGLPRRHWQGYPAPVIGYGMMLHVHSKSFTRAEELFDIDERMMESAEEGVGAIEEILAKCPPVFVVAATLSDVGNSEALKALNHANPAAAAELTRSMDSWNPDHWETYSAVGFPLVCLVSSAAPARLADKLTAALAGTGSKVIRLEEMANAKTCISPGQWDSVFTHDGQVALGLISGYRRRRYGGSRSRGGTQNYDQHHTKLVQLKASMPTPFSCDVKPRSQAWEAIPRKDASLIKRGGSTRLYVPIDAFTPSVPGQAGTLWAWHRLATALSDANAIDATYPGVIYGARVRDCPLTYPGFQRVDEWIGALVKRVRKTFGDEIIDYVLASIAWAEKPRSYAVPYNADEPSLPVLDLLQEICTTDKPTGASWTKLRNQIRRFEVVIEASTELRAFRALATEMVWFRGWCALGSGHLPVKVWPLDDDTCWSGRESEYNTGSRSCSTPSGVCTYGGYSARVEQLALCVSESLGKQIQRVLEDNPRLALGYGFGTPKQTRGWQTDDLSVGTDWEKSLLFVELSRENRAKAERELR